MKNIKKRAVAVVMAVSLVLTTTMVSVLPAYAEDSDTVTLDVSQGMVKINDDGYTIGDNEKVPFTGQYILTSNGNTTSNYVTISNCTRELHITLRNYYGNAYNGYIVTESSSTAILYLHLEGTNRKTYGGSGGKGLELGNVDTVYIDGTGTLNVSTSNFAASIYAKKLIINGGEITCSVQANASGIHATNGLTINGGTITSYSGTNVESGGFVINGGSLNSTVTKAPVDDDGNSLYQAVLSSNLGNAQVSELNITHSDGTALDYSSDSMSLSSGKLYLWLPEHEDYKITVNNGSFLGYLKDGASYFRQIPSATATYGQTLADVSLQNDFKWDDDTLSVGSVGINSFMASCWPNGNTEYGIFQNVSVNVNVTQASNSWTELLSIDESTSAPTASAKFGEVAFLYGASGSGPFTSDVPKTAGTWYVKAVVDETVNYTGLESMPIAFTVYGIIFGADSVWTLGNDGGLTIGGSGSYDDFAGVKVNDSTLDADDYVCVGNADSTYIILTADYLNVLSPGSYTFEMIWSGGSASTHFTVAEKTADVPSGGGGDGGTPSDGGMSGASSDGKMPASKSSRQVGKSDTPETGDETSAVWLFVLMFLSGGALYAVGKKNRAQRKYTL